MDQFTKKYYYVFKFDLPSQDRQYQIFYYLDGLKVITDEKILLDFDSELYHSPKIAD